ARPYVTGVLEGGDWFDELILGQSHVSGMIAVSRRLRKARIELAVLFPNSIRSALTAMMGRCHQRVGMARDYIRSRLLTHAVRPIRDAHGKLTPSPIIDDYNRIAAAAGCPEPGFRMELFTTAADEAAADMVWRQSRLQGRKVICLNPGAAFGSAKQWPSEYFAELARDFAISRDCGVLVLCGPSERWLAGHIVSIARHASVTSLADAGMPARCLGLTKACIRRCNLLVSTDSGPRHIAAAFQRPVVTLFGPTHIAWTETYYRHARHLQKVVPCGPCQLRVCPLDHRCMRELLPGEVARTAQRLLADSAAIRGGA
ncbi:MAG: glycosyltransferase family 9 protein, partial [Candidatus Acidiferrum sp.]